MNESAPPRCLAFVENVTGIASLQPPILRAPLFNACNSKCTTETTTAHTQQEFLKYRETNTRPLTFCSC